MVHLVPSSVENKQVIRQNKSFFFLNKRTDKLWRFVRTDYGEIMIMDILRFWRKYWTLGYQKLFTLDVQYVYNG